MFSGLSTLKRLDLGRNNLSYIDPYLFSNLTKLEFIGLYRNYISVLNSSIIFKNNIVLQEIDLSSNKIIYMDEDLFHNMNSIQIIDLKYNLFTKVDMNIIQGSSNIKLFCLLSDYFLSNFTLNLTEIKSLDVQSILYSTCNYHYRPNK
jgi:Leucine-rich repeat (LRR) protein